MKIVVNTVTNSSATELDVSLSFQDIKNAGTYATIAQELQAYAASKGTMSAIQFLALAASMLFA